MTPVRVQRRRVKGWRTPANTLYVGRSRFPSLHGNKYRIGVDGTAAECVEKFRADWEWGLSHPLGKLALQSTLRKLRGMNLSCWCGLCDRHKDGKPLNEACADCEPCHVDVLGEIVNR